MNPFGLSVTQVAGAAPVDTLVPAGELDRYFDITARIGAARAHAARALRRARAALQQQRRQARDLVEAELTRIREAAALELEQCIEQARCNAIANTVTWLISEQEIERVVAARLEHRFREALADALCQYAATEVPQALIARRFAPHLRSLAEHGKLTLRSHPDNLAALAGQLAAQMPEQAVLDLVADDGMAPGQAVLDSPFVQLRIDLARHLDTLLQHIHAADSHDSH